MAFGIVSKVSGDHHGHGYQLPTRRLRETSAAHKSVLDTCSHIVTDSDLVGHVVDLSRVGREFRQSHRPAACNRWQSLTLDVSGQPSGVRLSLRGPRKVITRSERQDHA